MSGKRYLCREVENNLASDSLEEADGSPFSKLSQREAEVARMILQGKNIQDISEALQLNAKTVNTYRYRLSQKLNIKNDVELTRLAISFNYFDTL